MLEKNFTRGVKSSKEKQPDNNEVINLDDLNESLDQVLGDTEIEFDVDAKKIDAEVETGIQAQLNAEKEKRDGIRERNIRNFKKLVSDKAAFEMLKKDNVEAVVNNTVAELMNEDNSLAGMMEDPRIVTDQLVPDAMEKIRAMEEMDKMTN